MWVLRSYWFLVIGGYLWSISTALSQVVISQIYGGGGNAGSVFRNDFIEILNTGRDSVNVRGWSVQYASAAGGIWQVTPLTGIILPGYYYLIQEAQGSGGTTDLPSPEATGSIAMAATSGKVALVGGTAALAGTCPQVPEILDLVGYGTAGCFEGSGAAAAPGNTLALFRRDGGQTDTGDNSADFLTAAPMPRNGGYPPLPVQLVSFSASLLPPTVLLEWRTLTEVNNYGFYIQRGGPGAEAPADIPGAFVPGGGTTSVPQRYSWTDSMPLPVNLRYRLKQVDLDGTIHYSHQIAVDASVLAVSEQGWKSPEGLEVWPNPFNPGATVGFVLRVRSRVSVSVCDVLGRVILTLADCFMEPGFHTLPLDGSRLASGAYFCSLQTNAGMEVRRIAIVR